MNKYNIQKNYLSNNIRLKTAENYKSINNSITNLQ